MSIKVAALVSGLLFALGVLVQYVEYNSSNSVNLIPIYLTLYLVGIFFIPLCSLVYWISKKINKKDGTK